MKYRYTKQGVHLFDRCTGINILMDEFVCSDDILSVAPANVSIALTNRCNRSCAHCFVPKVDAMLDSATVCDWVSELNDNGCLGVGFGGGEPFLYPDLCHVCQYVQSKTSMACTLTTNGDFLDNSTIEWMKHNVNFARISTNGAALNFSRIESLTKYLSIGINYLLNERTFPDLGETIKSCADVGVKEVLLLPQIETDCCRGVGAEFLLMVDDWLMSTTLPLRVTISAFSSDGMKSISAIPGDVGARQYLHISADGLVKTSSIAQTGVAIGKKTLIQTIKEVYCHENMV